MEPDGRAAPLRRDASVDVCIVGGGYAGLWTALQLRELDSSRSVMVLEADVCGGGASGRNGGFAFSWWAKFPALEQLYGTAEAIRLAQISAAGVGELESFCADNQIDCDFVHQGWVWTATSDAQRGAWESTIAAIEAAGVASPFTYLGAEEVARKLGSVQHREGVHEAAGAIVQPALLARGLRRVALERGVRIHEGTPVERLESGRRAVSVTTRGGTVAAGRVVLAANAWLATLPPFRRSIFVVSSDVIATPPLPDELARLGWARGDGGSNSRLMVNYYRPTADGRVVLGRGGGTLAFGGRLGRRFDYNEEQARLAHRDLGRLFPSLAATPVDRAWAGPVDRSVTGLPRCGTLGVDPRIAYAVGFSGNGVVPTMLAGGALAALTLDHADEASVAIGAPPAADARIASLPPEPIRYLGGRIVRVAVARKEAAEDRGASPRWLARRLSSLVPSGVVDATRQRVNPQPTGRRDAG